MYTQLPTVHTTYPKLHATHQTVQVQHNNKININLLSNQAQTISQNGIRCNPYLSKGSQVQRRMERSLGAHVYCKSDLMRIEEYRQADQADWTWCRILCCVFYTFCISVVAILPPTHFSLNLCLILFSVLTKYTQTHKHTHSTTHTHTHDRMEITPSNSEPTWAPTPPEIATMKTA